MLNHQPILFKEELFYELLFQGYILVDFNQGFAFNTHTRQIMGRINESGYVALSWNYNLKKIHMLAHRLIWMAANGPIPTELQINHKNGVKTDNRLINLEIVTCQENIRHSYDMGLNSGEFVSAGLKEYYTINVNAGAKLTQDQVLEILDLYNSDPVTHTTGTLASRYGVHRKRIYDIVNNNTYRPYTSNTKL